MGHDTESNKNHARGPRLRENGDGGKGGIYSDTRAGALISFGYCTSRTGARYDSMLEDDIRGIDQELRGPVLGVKVPFKKKTMPRANRSFLPGYIWHVTINTAVSSNRSKRLTAALCSSR